MVKYTLMCVCFVNTRNYKVKSRVVSADILDQKWNEFLCIEFESHVRSLKNFKSFDYQQPTATILLE